MLSSSAQQLPMAIGTLHLCMKITHHLHVHLVLLEALTDRKTAHRAAYWLWTGDTSRCVERPYAGLRIHGSDNQPTPWLLSRNGCGFKSTTFVSSPSPFITTLLLIIIIFIIIIRTSGQHLSDDPPDHLPKHWFAGFIEPRMIIRMIQNGYLLCPTHHASNKP